MPLPERVVEDGFQLYQALFGPARQMQSYYGSSPTAKRFEVTLCERELQLPEGVVRAWNGKIRPWGRGQQQEEPFGGAALVDLPDGMKIGRTRSYQDGHPKCGFEPLTNPAEYYFLGLPRAHKGSSAT
jgi:hypothetical protein